MSTFQQGKKSEQLAISFLEREGYRILERNYRNRLGEIDIIAEEGSILCFVEVRSCRSRVFGDPLETINFRKQARIIRTAQHYILVRRREQCTVRFDAISITYEPEEQICLVRGAFEGHSYW